MTTDAEKSGTFQTGANLVVDDQQGVVTISDAIRFLWRGRLWVAAAAAIGLLLGLVFVVASAISKPSVTSYRAAITITMLGAEKFEDKAKKVKDVLTVYPNGAPFAPSDLRSPIVLEAAYKQID